jgi:hypothetical protein
MEAGDPAMSPVAAPPPPVTAPQQQQERPDPPSSCIIKDDLVMSVVPLAEAVYVSHSAIAREEQEE